MADKKILQEFISEYCSTKNYLEKRNFKIQFVENSILEKKHIKFGRDYRCDINKFKNNIISLVVTKQKFKDNKPYDKIVFTITFILFDETLSKEIFFWKIDKAGMFMKKIFLNEIKNINNPILSIGYAKFDVNEKKKSIIGLYIVNLLKTILSSFDFFVFNELQGSIFLPEKFLSMNEISISEIEKDIPNFISYPGKVNTESLSMLKLYEWLDLSRQDNLYHKTTLGPIYFSK